MPLGSFGQVVSLWRAQVRFLPQGFRFAAALLKRPPPPVERKTSRKWSVGG
jgi:hypothetical protein